MADGNQADVTAAATLWRDVAIVVTLYVAAAIPAVVKGQAFALDWLISVPLGGVLATLSIIDLRRFILPDALTLPLILAGLAASWWLGWDNAALRALAAVLGFLILVLTARIYRQLRGHEGLGLGDAKLLAAAGAWLGLEALPQVLLTACLLALAGVAALMAAGRKMTMKTAIPFGPFLAFATWLVWLYGSF